MSRKADAIAVAAAARGAMAPCSRKTNVPELAGAIETDNLVYGRTNNPYDLVANAWWQQRWRIRDRCCRRFSLGLGTDAGGSIRVPAHFSAAWQRSGQRPVAYRERANFRCRWAPVTQFST